MIHIITQKVFSRKLLFLFYAKKDISVKRDYSLRVNVINQKCNSNKSSISFSSLPLSSLMILVLTWLWRNLTKEFIIFIISKQKNGCNSQLHMLTIQEENILLQHSSFLLHLSIWFMIKIQREKFRAGLFWSILLSYFNGSSHFSENTHFIIILIFPSIGI